MSEALDSISQHFQKKPDRSESRAVKGCSVESQFFHDKEEPLCSSRREGLIEGLSPLASVLRADLEGGAGF